MKIEKIKQIKPAFDPNSGPSEVVTLGFKVGNRSFILGEFYEGQYMIENHGLERQEVEKIIDSIVTQSIPVL